MGEMTPLPPTSLSWVTGCTTMMKILSSVSISWQGHNIVTLSALLTFWSLMYSPHKSQECETLMCHLLFAWTSCQINNFPSYPWFETPGRLCGVTVLRSRFGPGGPTQLPFKLLGNPFLWLFVTQCRRVASLAQAMAWSWTSAKPLPWNNAVLLSVEHVETNICDISIGDKQWSWYLLYHKLCLD